MNQKIFYELVMLWYIGEEGFQRYRKRGVFHIKSHADLEGLEETSTIAYIFIFHQRVIF